MNQAHPKTPEHLKGLISEQLEVDDWFKVRKGELFHRADLNRRLSDIRHLTRILDNGVENGSLQRMYVTEHDPSNRKPGAYYGAV